ncbi:unnamed protein product [Cyprideis torosa]|uniref:Uncharacterized protein n=1 Tax=Cyprideis torosa TaxID=163714 RepID=A0A7R8W6J6_9CRUS|nr:unnamed protein product [Cyprideis torosa]CAG0881118.1 unnamed protein product [Cyprideis torosa]
MMQSASDIQNPPPPALTWTTATVYSPVLVLEPSRPSPPTPTSARPIRILPKPPPVTSASCTVGSSGYATPVSKIPVTENSTPSTGPASGSKYQPLAARLTPNGSRARDRFLLSKLDKKRNDKACLLISQKTQEQLLSCFHRNESLLVDYIQGRHLELLFCLVERFRRNLGIQQFHYILNTMNIRGESPLSAAIRLGDQDLLAYLLECGANPLTRISHDSDTALHLMAREAGNLPMIQTLLQWTPPVRIQQLMNAFNGRGLSPLHVAIESWTASNNTEKTIQLLLEKGGAVKTSNGASVFHLASQKDTSDVFRLILGIHPHAVEDLNSQDRVGNTALHAIAKNAILPDQEKVRMLVMLIGKYRGNGSIRNSQGRLCKDYLSHFAKSLFRQGEYGQIL